MKRYLITLICFILFLISVNAENINTNRIYINSLKSSFDTDDIILLSGSPYRIAKIVNKDKSINYYVQSNDFIKVFGYQGYTNLGIVTDSLGNIISVKIIESDDTRSFIRKINNSSFLNQFINHDSDKTYKTVTGATISSNAINNTIKKIIPLIKSSIKK